MAYKTKNNFYERESKNFNVLNKHVDEKLQELKKKEKRYDVK